MGKPFALELNRLPETYRWALGEGSNQLEAAIAKIACTPLVATGSGGSLTAAHLAVALQHECTGQLARAVTPMELYEMKACLRGSSLILFSAGGRNADILKSFEFSATAEPKNLLVLCGQPNSPLAELAKKYSYVDLVELKLPFGKDGFLATNSLLCFSTLVAKTYAKLFGGPEMPSTVDALVQSSSGKFDEKHWDKLRAALSQHWQRETLVVLYSPDLFPGIADIESKFVEAALGNVQFADLRNFAHGRHHWLAKRGEQSAVLALITPQYRELAEKTLQLIPKRIPVSTIDVPHSGGIGALSAIVTAFYLALFAGESRGIDPGRPGVPTFGRKLYHIRSGPRKMTGVSQWQRTVIERKAGIEMSILERTDQAAFWQQSLKRFLEHLKKATFSSLVLDYDGTLFSKDRQDSDAQAAIFRVIERLIEDGVKIGIATGRGKSVRMELRSLLRKHSWGKVVVGYYNGSQIAMLSDEDAPCSEERVCPELKVVSEKLRLDPRLNELATLTLRDKQITIEPKKNASPDCIWNLVHDHAVGDKNVSAVRSTHSVDVLATGVTKRRVVAQIASTHGVLAIGDQGLWPGNDFDLLRSNAGLSANETSRAPEFCWNIAPAGFRGVQATACYLNALATKDGQFSVLLDEIISSKVA